MERRWVLCPCDWDERCDAEIEVVIQSGCHALIRYLIFTAHGGGL